jgi:uncharacterized protein (DUF1684 family)
LAIPKTREEALLQMRLVWLAFVVSVPLYVFIGETTQYSWLNFRNAESIFVVFGALNLLSFTWILRNRYSPSLRDALTQPDNPVIVRRWMTSWMIAVCNANALLVTGLILRMGGKTLRQTLLFWVVGTILILSLWPRKIWSSAKMATR